MTGAFYRFLPNEKRHLYKGGRLQALVIKGYSKAETSNRHSEFWSQGQSFHVTWVDLDDVESPDDSLRLQAFRKGAARFSRGEGLYFGQGELFFTCTSGGAHEFGQIIRYVPSPFEGQSQETDQPGTITLFMESKDDRVFDYGDNLTVSPWGDLFVCEDRYSDTLKNHIRIVTKNGKVATFARNADAENSEFAGVCFSPDGSTLFANIQTNGITLAIAGPWSSFKAT